MWVGKGLRELSDAGADARGLERSRGAMLLCATRQARDVFLPVLSSHDPSAPSGARASRLVCSWASELVQQSTDITEEEQEELEARGIDTHTEANMMQINAA